MVEYIQHEIIEKPIAVYNFEVLDNHNYYVAESVFASLEQFVLVHNSCGANSKGFNNISENVGTVGKYKKVRVDAELGGVGKVNVHVQGQGFNKAFWNGTSFIGAPNQINKSKKVMIAVDTVIKKAFSRGWPF